MRDLRHAVRLLIKSPGFSAAGILALALGIGANTAIFSVVHAVLIAPLPYEDAGRLVMVWEDASRIGFPRNTPAPGNWTDWRAQNTVFTDIAATRGAVYNISGDGFPEQAFARRVTGNFWTVLGVKPAIGRVFTAEEDRQDSPVVVISHGLWTRRYGSDPGVVGRKILLNDRPFTVVGVMPREFGFLPSRLIDVWTPIAFTPQDLANRGSHFLHCVARLKPGVGERRANEEMTAIMRRIGEQHASQRDVGVEIVPLREQFAGNRSTALLALLGGAGCVLLIACANIANLLLARGAVRRREFAVRAALGAGRGRLVRQLLTESLLLASLGMAGGLLLAQASLRFLEELVPVTMTAAPLALDRQALVFAAAVAIAAVLLFGLAPALRVSRHTLHGAMKLGGRGSAGGGHWLRDSLVVVETALAVLLLSGAGLMIRTLYNLYRVDLGIRVQDLLTMDTFLPRSRYPEHAQREAFFNSVLEKVRIIPGVVNAGYISVLPTSERGNTSGYILAGQDASETRTQDALFRVVTADYFQTAGARVREGRLFNAADRAGVAPAAIVNELFADRHFRGQSALGKRFQMGRWGPEFHWYSIVGVIREIRERGIDVDLKPAVYLVHPQAAQAWPVPSALVIRTAVEPHSIASSVRQAIWSIDKDQPVARVRSMEEVIDTALAAPRQSSQILGGFAVLALLLACLGVYGVLSYAVTQRTSEIGLRMALGARPGDVLAMIAARGLSLVGAGLAIGIAASLAAARLLTTVLFGVKPNDAATLAAVSLTLLVVATAACLVPARRAARVDPVVALRDE